MEYRRYTVKGHRLIHSRSGVQDAYARGDCECGWTYTGWTERVRDVVQSHNSHLENLLWDRGWRVYRVNGAWEIFAADPLGAARVRASQRRIKGFLFDSTATLVGDNEWTIDGRRYKVTEGDS